MTTQTEQAFDSTDGMTDACRDGLRNLLLACADTKLLLGYHYGEWTFGPPALEAAIASCSLAQAELGHVRLLHAVLKKNYDDDPDQLVDQRASDAFANVSYLDRPITDWFGLVAANYAVDLALTRLLYAMRGSSFKPLRMSVEKMLDEERYHIHHGQGWLRTLAGKGDASKRTLQDRVQAAIDAVAVWFGPADDEQDRALVTAGIKRQSNAEILRDFLMDVAETMTAAGMRVDLERPRTFAGWDPATRRLVPGGPEEEILQHLRGTKNEIFKLT